MISARCATRRLIYGGQQMPDKSPTTEVHILKTWPEYFEAVASGAKTFELRFDDRGYQVGDHLVLREWSVTEGYTGRVIVKRVSYLVRGGVFGLTEDHVCMGLQDVE